jgi:hypothetical protein
VLNNEFGENVEGSIRCVLEALTGHFSEFPGKHDENNQLGLSIKFLASAC